MFNTLTTHRITNPGTDFVSLSGVKNLVRSFSWTVETARSGSAHGFWDQPNSRLRGKRWVDSWADSWTVTQVVLVARSGR